MVIRLDDHQSGGDAVSADCLFCKIAAKQIPAKLIHEDADVFAFEDINPQAPTAHPDLSQKTFCFAGRSHAGRRGGAGKNCAGGSEAGARTKTGSGYRTVINTGSGAGQTVFHLHMHLLGGRDFHWPPG